MSDTRLSAEERKALRYIVATSMSNRDMVNAWEKLRADHEALASERIPTEVREAWERLRTCEIIDPFAVVETTKQDFATVDAFMRGDWR